MAFTVHDFHDMVRLLNQHPEWQAELRRILLADDFLALPAIVRDLAEAQQRTEAQVERLIEAQQRTEAQVERLTEAQQRTEARLERLEATVQSLAEAQQRTEARLEQLAEAQQRTEAKVAQLAEAQQRTEAQVGQLAEAQQRTDARLEELSEAQQRTEAELKQLSAEVHALTTDVDRFMKWQEGEAGRREGERYEQRIIRAAPAFFNGGQGGSPDDSAVYQRLLDLIQRVPDLASLAEEGNPFLADLIWWKDNQCVVVEISRVVNGHDVDRAARRAETLQEINVQAIGMVIGKRWLGEEFRDQAIARAVQWRVGDDLSDGYLAFCRWPA